MRKLDDKIIENIHAFVNERTDDLLVPFKKLIKEFNKSNPNARAAHYQGTLIRSMYCLFIIRAVGLEGEYWSNEMPISEIKPEILESINEVVGGFLDTIEWQGEMK